MEKFVPRNPRFAETVSEVFDQQGFMTLIGATLSHIAPGEIAITAPVSAHVSQQDGYVHGGVVASIADSAAGFSALSLMPSGSSVLTIEFKINFLAPAAGEVIVAQGRVIKPGRTVFVCAADVTATRGGMTTPIATAQLTMMHLAEAGNGS